jgi:hypothetical protein
MWQMIVCDNGLEKIHPCHAQFTHTLQRAIDNIYKYIETRMHAAHAAAPWTRFYLPSRGCCV